MTNPKRLTHSFILEVWIDLDGFDSRSVTTQPLATHHRVLSNFVVEVIGSSTLNGLH